MTNWNASMIKPHAQRSMMIAGITRICSKCARVRRIISGHRARASLQRLISNTYPLKVILGAGGTERPGWIATDKDSLDIADPSSWQRLFCRGSISWLLCEHVLEHLEKAQVMSALRCSFQYLEYGGVLRIAVPDGNRKDAVYVAVVKPPNDGHKLLFSIDSLSRMLLDVGFKVQPLEWFDNKGAFHANDWDPNDGIIARSSKFDKQESFRFGQMYYTSLIIDARKE